MRTAILQIKRAGNMQIVNNSDLSHKLLRFLLTSLGALALCYAFLIATMVFNIVERRSLEADARDLGNEVGELELEYLAASNKIDLNLAASMGFTEGKKQFATRTSLGSLKVATNEL